MGRGGGGTSPPPSHSSNLTSSEWLVTFFWNLEQDIKCFMKTFLEKTNLLMSAIFLIMVFVEPYTCYVFSLSLWNLPKMHVQCLFFVRLLGPFIFYCSIFYLKVENYLEEINFWEIDFHKDYFRRFCVSVSKFVKLSHSSLRKNKSMEKFYQICLLPWLKILKKIILLWIVYIAGYGLYFELLQISIISQWFPCSPILNHEKK